MAERTMTRFLWTDAFLALLVLVLLMLLVLSDRAAY